MTCVDEKLHGLKLAFKLLCSLSEFMFACFDWLNSENTEWEYFALFDLWSEMKLIKYKGIKAPAERPQLIYNAKFQFKFYIDRL